MNSDANLLLPALFLIGFAGFVWMLQLFRSAGSAALVAKLKYGDVHKAMRPIAAYRRTLVIHCICWAVLLASGFLFEGINSRTTAVGFILFIVLNNIFLRYQFGRIARQAVEQLKSEQAT